MSEPLKSRMSGTGSTHSYGRDPVSRRRFIGMCGAGLCLLSGAALLMPDKKAHAQRARRGFIGTKLSTYFTPLEDGAVRCDLCPRSCHVKEGKRGFCRVRENRAGKYYSLVYGNPCAVHLDPIEKKPFYHVCPSTRSFSIATAGCNLACKFCQNWEISQATPEEVFAYDLPPERIVQEAVRSGARSIAYTYVEPVIFYEYMMDICQLARKAGLLNVCHSNAFVNQKPLEELCKVMDAANCDLKGFTEKYYRDMCSGRLEPVLETLKTYRNMGVHLELTNLVVPTRNDDMSLVDKMCRWISKELGNDTPVHFSRFFPLYKLQGLPPTPVATLEKIRDAALHTGLKYVYIGNIGGHEGENTFCPRCGKIVIARTGYVVDAVHLKEGRCVFCNEPIPGIWT